MSFSRVKPGNWTLNEKLTSAQQNLLDIDHANAVDKTGDTVPGTIGVAGALQINSGGAFTALAGSSVTMGAGSLVQLSPGGINNLIVGNNTNLKVQAGSSIECLGSMTATGSLFANSFELLAGNRVKVSSRTITRSCRVGFSGTSPSPGPPLVWPYFVNSVADEGAYWVQNTTVDRPYMLFPLECGHNTVLTKVVVVLRPAGGHVALPSTQPSVEIIRKQLSVPPANAWDPAGIEIAVPFGAANIGQYNNVDKEFDINLSMPIDRTGYAYFVRVYGEYGVANTIVGLRVSYPRYQCTTTECEEF